METQHKDVIWPVTSVPGLFFQAYVNCKINYIPFMMEYPKQVYLKLARLWGFHI